MSPRALLTTLLLATFLGCSSTPSNPSVPDQVALGDGLYVIVRSEPLEQPWPALEPGHERVRYERELLSDEPRSPEVLVLDTAQAVPLVLEGPPVVGTSAKGFTSLQLTLAPEARDQLTRVSTANVGRGVALLIGGRVASSHGIKEPITGGGFQLSRCNDEGCRFVLSRLQSR